MKHRYVDISGLILDKFACCMTIIMNPAGTISFLKEKKLCLPFILSTTLFRYEITISIQK